MTLKGKKSLYLLTPVLLLIILLGLYVVFQIPRRGYIGQPNVLFITMDSLRHDHLGCTGYERAHTPNIDALARDGAVFTEAVAQGTWTRISVPSIVSGKHPYSIGIRILGGDLDSSHTTLAEVLSANRYSTYATNLVWSESFYQGFQKTESSNVNTSTLTDRILQALEEHKDHKFLLWLYYWDPHAPYEPPEEFMRLYEPNFGEIPKTEWKDGSKEKTGGLRDHSGHYNGSIATLIRLNQGRIKLTAWDRDHLINLYDAEIAYVDTEIGKVVAKLKKLGLYDNTLIVLNSDHGEAFGEHHKYYHGMTVYDEMARVPLIIKPPHSRNRKKRIPGSVRNIDIMPTILDYCGFKAPKDCHGQSLRPFIEGDATPNLPGITETHRGTGMKFHLMAIRHQDHKLIYDLAYDRAWLYNLRADPRERNSLLPEAATIEPSLEEAQEPARQQEQQMRKELMDLLSLRQLADLTLTGEDLPEIDQKTREQLKALGYVY
jgi:arylsulfatase